MAKAEFIRARVDDTLKADTELLFSRLGLTMTEAITLFLRQCDIRQGLPFEVRLPKYSASTEAAFKEGEEMLASGNYKRYTNTDEMFADILAGNDDDV